MADSPRTIRVKVCDAAVLLPSSGAAAGYRTPRRPNMNTLAAALGREASRRVAADIADANARIRALIQKGSRK